MKKEDAQTLDFIQKRLEKLHNDEVNCVEKLASIRKEIKLLESWMTLHSPNKTSAKLKSQTAKPQIESEDKKRIPLKETIYKILQNKKVGDRINVKDVHKETQIIMGRPINLSSVSTVFVRGSEDFKRVKPGLYEILPKQIENQSLFSEKGEI